MSLEHHRVPDEEPEEPEEPEDLYAHHRVPGLRRSLESRLEAGYDSDEEPEDLYAQCRWDGTKWVATDRHPYNLPAARPNRAKRRREARRKRLIQRADMKLAAAFEGFRVDPEGYAKMVYQGHRAGILTVKQAEMLGAALRRDVHG